MSDIDRVATIRSKTTDELKRWMQRLINLKPTNLNQWLIHEIAIELDRRNRK
jgi:hypothetical protein